MKYKYCYNEEDNICELKDVDDLNESIKIRIDLNQKSVHNLFDFFKSATIKVLLSNEADEIELDESDIKSEEFYKQDNFEQLLKLINDANLKCNKLIKEISEEVSEEISK